MYKKRSLLAKHGVELSEDLDVAGHAEHLYKEDTAATLKQRSNVVTKRLD